jgi:hypothetical protein
MKKDNIRDYATEAFRFYAVVGIPAINYKGDRGELEDLRAVEKTLEEFEKDVFKRDTILPLIKEVYFTHADKEMKKGEIRNRVVNSCNNLNISESTAYRYLKKARISFAHNRGLRAV